MQTEDSLKKTAAVKTTMIAGNCTTHDVYTVSQSVSLLHSHIDKVVNMQTKYIELDLRVYVCVR